MNTGYGRSFLTVAAVHIAIVAVLMISGTITSCRKEKKVFTALPIQFVAAIPAAVIPEPPTPVPAPPEPPAKKIPEPQKKKVAKKKAPPPKPKRIKRKMDTTPRPTPLSKTEIERMLNIPSHQQTTAQPVTPIANDVMYETLIRQTFYDAWDNQPSYDDVGGKLAVVQIGLGPDGLVTSRKLITKSGNAVLDNSVLQLINSVRRIPGLSDDFTERHRTVRVSFKVEP